MSRFLRSHFLFHFTPSFSHFVYDPLKSAYATKVYFGNIESGPGDPFFLLTEEEK